MSSKNSTKIVYASIIVVGGILVYLYCTDKPKHVNPHHPVNPIIIHTAPVGHAGLETFAFSDVKNSYVHDGVTDLSFVHGATGENINGIFTNFKGAEGEVLDIGQALTNEMDMGQRDPRVIESYMNGTHYGAGVPNYRALAGYY